MHIMTDVVRLTDDFLSVHQRGNFVNVLIVILTFIRPRFGSSIKDRQTYEQTNGQTKVILQHRWQKYWRKNH